MATYVNDLRLKEITTGDESGTWGTSTNTNLELIADAFSYATKDCFATDADATETMADGSADEIRSLYLKVTSSATLTATRTLTLAPNTVSKVWIIENATTGSQSISISQGSGANVTIPNGDVKVIYTDGAGATAAVTDAFANLKVTDAAQTNITSVGTLSSLTVSGDATFDTNTLYVDSTNNRVGVGTTSPATKLDVSVVGGMARVGGAAGNNLFQTYTGSVGGGIWAGGQTRFYSTGSMTLSTGATLTTSDPTGYTDAVTIDSSGNVGIGTSSPQAPLHARNGSSGVSSYTAGTRAIIEGTATTYLTIAAPNTSLSGILFADPDDSDNGYIKYDHSAGGVMDFGTAGSQRLRIDSSGNVGIGTTSPDDLLHVFAGDSTASASTLSAVNIENNDDVALTFMTPNNKIAQIRFADPQDTGNGIFSYDHSTAAMIFSTNGPEKVRINSNGALLIGTSIGGLTSTGTSFNSSGTGAMVCDLTSANEIFSYNNNNASGASYEIDFRQNNSEVGKIAVGSSTTSYNTSSDYRLKENIQPLKNGLERVKQLNPVQFDWKKDGTSSEGFIAHEVQEIFSDAIVGEKDGDKIQGMDYGRITPLLVKAIQEQQVLIEQLQAEVALLKGE